jgi:hypothetical protein
MKSDTKAILIFYCLFLPIGFVSGLHDRAKRQNLKNAHEVKIVARKKSIPTYPNPRSKPQWNPEQPLRIHDRA